MKDAAALAVPVPDDKRAQVEAHLSQLFALMDYPATLQFQDMPDGSLGVAVHFGGELPGIALGKRSHLLDCVQFWLNKVVNRPNSPRRWVNLGLNAFPSPRSAAASAPPAATAPQPSAPKTAPPKKPDTKLKAAPQAELSDERSVKPAPNPALAALGKTLAEKAVKHGRLYGILSMNAEQRAVLLQAAQSVPQLNVQAEGEGHWRRVAFRPDKVTPLAKKHVMPDFDDEDE